MTVLISRKNEVNLPHQASTAPGVRWTGRRLDRPRLTAPPRDRASPWVRSGESTSGAEWVSTIVVRAKVCIRATRTRTAAHPGCARRRTVVKHLVLTSEWLENWSPKSRTEIADRGCKGLVVRCGPGGKVFYAWSQERDTEGDPRRRRVRLGSWPMLSLPSAPEARSRAPRDAGSFTCEIRSTRGTCAPRPRCSRS
jgi:hypothetical protein